MLILIMIDTCGPPMRGENSRLMLIFATWAVVLMLKMDADPY